MESESKPNERIVTQSLASLCDVRIGSLLLLLGAICLLCLQRWSGLIAALIVSAPLFFYTRESLDKILRSMWPLAFIVFFILFFGTFAFSGSLEGLSADAQSSSRGIFGLEGGLFQGVPDVSILPWLRFSLAGLENALFNVVRITLLAALGFSFMYGYRSEAILDALRFYLSPFNKIKIPADDIALSVSLALRFIPLFSAELTQLKRAQSARGARFESGGLYQRIAANARLLIPLCVGMFRRSDSLAITIEARCYGAAYPRSSLNSVSFTRRDVLILLSGVVAYGIVLLLGYCV